ncbi:protein transport protein gos1, variant 2 [Entomophthora muscae]|uniref:Protein transport protein gos1, variant 2 n=1 Tax=Entomophthora muscae TaxID=34485 RepID=A0ACC2UKB4_9FUNG|nr:protein transport protein gos1, variant 2 [Entomophthora muscae]
MSSKEPLLNQQPAKDFSGFSKQARQLGLTLEKQIGTLSKLTFKREAANPLGTSSPDNFLEARNLRQNIGTKLAEFKNLVERMEDILTEYGNDLSDPTLPHTFRRHSEQLSQFQQEFSKIEVIELLKMTVSVESLACRSEVHFVFVSLREISLVYKGLV